MITAGYLRPDASVQTALRACCMRLSASPNIILLHSKSEQLSLGSHSLVALPSNAAREEVVRFKVRVRLVSYSASQSLLCLSPQRYQQTIPPSIAQQQPTNHG